MTTSKPEKFSFNQDFFEIEIAKKHAEAQTEAITAAREEGYQEGMTAGMEKGKQSMATEYTTHLANMESKLNVLNQLKQQFAHDLQSQALSLIKKMLKTTLDHAAEHYNEEIFNHTLQKTLEAVGEETNLVVRLHPSTIVFFNQLKDQDASNPLFQDKTIRLQPDSNLAPGDCLVEWETGGIDARLEQTLQDFINLLSSAKATKPDTDNVTAQEQPSPEEAEDLTEETKAPTESEENPPQSEN